MCRWPMMCVGIALTVACACGRNIELGHDFGHNSADSAVGDSGQLTRPISDAQTSTIQSCSSAQQCYPNLDASTLNGGGAVCLTQFPNGYCTHLVHNRRGLLRN